MKKIFSIVLLLLVFFFSQNVVASAQEETLEATVTNILEEKEVEVMEKKQLSQKLELVVTKGSLINKVITVESGNLPIVNLPKYKAGDKVILTYNKDLEGNEIFYITDYIRRDSLLSLFLIFVILTILIAGLRGMGSLLGMGISFSVIFVFILPKILAGADPVATAIAGSLIIIPCTFYLSHGFNKKTTTAIIGTLLTLGITGILARTFIEAAKLTGYSSEEASFLQAYKPGLINIKGLLLAGIIIGVLGVLDDITVSQAAIVEQLKKANPKFKINKLYTNAMNVGKDHISSMVNTLVLVYTGAALPLLLLFIDSPQPFSEVVNYEIIANEIVRTLVGSIGLILAVPITTFLTALVVSKTA